MRTKSNISGTHFYVYENNPNIGITKFFTVGTLVEAQQLAGVLNCAFGVSDIPIVLDLVGGRLAMAPIAGVGLGVPTTAHAATLPATTANRRGVKRGVRKAAKRAAPLATI